MLGLLAMFGSAVSRTFFAALWVTALGCGSSERQALDGGSPSDASPARDAGVLEDGGLTPGDGATSEDSGAPDAGSPDTGPPLELRIPPGRFTMGDAARDELEREVEITRAFMIQVAEVTQAEWNELFPTNPSGTQDDAHPVERISWYDALAYANARSAQAGLTPCYDLSACSGQPGAVGAGAAYTCPDPLQFDLTCEGYRLPTEAEWEYAARLGLDEEAECRGDADIDMPASRCGVLGYTTHPVRDRAADHNELHGMRSNVAEWVWDWFDTYRPQDVIDPLGPANRSLRVTRGGGWTFHARGCRVSHRSPRYPSCQTDSVGVRLVRTVE